MIDKNLLKQTVDEALAGTNLYPVDITVSPDNVISIEIDSADGVDIDSCAALTRAIEAAFDRDVEDYELEVGSAGITSPLKIRAQYAKNVGNEMEVLTRDGRKLHGVLAAVEAGDPADTDVAFTLRVTSKQRQPGAKRPVEVTEDLALSSADCKYVRYDLKF